MQVNNQTLVSLATGGNPVNQTSTPFSVGCDYNTSAPGTELAGLDGSLGPIGFWKRMLTAGERQTLYGALPYATLTGQCYWANSSPSVLSNGSCLNFFTGTNGYLPLPASFSLDKTASSFSIWFNANTISSKGMIVGKNGNASVYIRVLTTTSIRVATDGGGLEKDFTVPAITIGNTTWYNLIVTRSANTTRVFLNGVESSSGGQAQNDTITIDQVGAFNTQNILWDGYLSDMKVFNSVLSSADIAAINAGTVTIAVPTLYLAMKEGIGTTTKNFTPGATPPEGLQYADLPQVMRDESRSTFVSWWDMDETSGVRFDKR